MDSTTEDPLRRELDTALKELRQAVRGYQKRSSIQVPRSAIPGAMTVEGASAALDSGVSQVRQKPKAPPAGGYEAVRTQNATSAAASQTPRPVGAWGYAVRRVWEWARRLVGRRGR